MTREVINELKKYTLGKKNTETVKINVLHLNRVIKALEQMESSSEKPNKSEIPTDWIPVSESLPEEDGEYLLFGKITDEDKNCIIIGEYDAWMEKFGIWQERLNIGTRDLSSDFYEYESVIAWQPLPEPYKEESEDK